MKYLQIGIIVVLLGIIGWMAIPKTGVLGGPFGQPGIVDLGETAFGSGSYRFAAGQTVTALAANPTRVYARCTNAGKGTIYLAFASTASGSWGIGLVASESYEIFANQNLYRGIIRATSATATRISCVER